MNRYKCKKNCIAANLEPLTAALASKCYELK